MMRSNGPLRWRAMIYVQHLLGIGHLMRTVRIARALADAQFEVTVVSGGMPVPGLDVGAARFVQLPPVKAGEAGFSALAHADGSAFDEYDKAARSADLLRIFEDIQPHALLIEAFPFGRRQMRFELVPLLEHARQRAEPVLIASSIRDILQEQKTPGRVEETISMIERFFDLVLVHGDAGIVPLDASFPLATRFAGKIAYTGMVAEAGADGLHLGPVASHDVIVSVGGGAVGEALLRTAMDARPLCGLNDAHWLLLTGPNMPQATVGELRAVAEHDVTIERFVPDLAARLKGARLSISQAGYNTVADILAAGCASVLVPFAAGGETEQSVRADILEKRGRAVSIAEAGLTAQALASAIDRAVSLPPMPNGIALDGAQNTARILSERLSETFQRSPISMNRV